MPRGKRKMISVKKSGAVATKKSNCDQQQDSTVCIPDNQDGCIKVTVTKGKNVGCKRVIHSKDQGKGKKNFCQEKPRELESEDDNFEGREQVASGSAIIEDDNIIQMEVGETDFLSDGEIQEGDGMENITFNTSISHSRSRSQSVTGEGETEVNSGSSTESKTSIQEKMYSQGEKSAECANSRKQQKKNSARRRRRSSSVSHSRSQGKAKRRSMERRIDELSKNILVMQQMMLKQGDAGGTTASNGGSPRPKNRGKTTNVTKFGRSDSETTIYKNVLQQVDLVKYDRKAKARSIGVNRFSSSSSDDRHLDSSNELWDFEDMFIAECAEEARHSREGSNPREEGCQEDQGDQIMREAEAAKARMFTTPGKHNSPKVKQAMLTGRSLIKTLTAVRFTLTTTTQLLMKSI